jgi:hypothetical protein
VKIVTRNKFEEEHSTHGNVENGSSDSMGRGKAKGKGKGKIKGNTCKGK